MADQRIGNVASALASSLAARVDLTDAHGAGVQADLVLQARVMDLYAEQLQSLPEAEALPWLLRRMAMIEARLLGLQSGALGQSEAVLTMAEDAPPATLLNLPCDADLVQSGFYAAERSQDGVAFRWVGPDPRATVFLPRLRTPVTIRLRVLSAFLPEVLDEVRMALDGGEWVPATRLEGVGDVTLSAVLPAGPIGHAGLLRLDIDTARTESPLTRGSTDERHLSLAFSAIEAESF
jgi:hypothetical protein